MVITEKERPVSSWLEGINNATETRNTDIRPYDRNKWKVKMNKLHDLKSRLRI